MAEVQNVSADLLWELTRHQNAFLVKRRTGGGVQFSRDPLNLTNKHSRKHAGFVNDKAIGLAPGKDGQIMQLKKSSSSNKPVKNITSTTHGSGKSGRSIYKSVAGSAAKEGYRADLRSEAVARASALKQSQRPVRETPAAKPRGKKALAKAAAEEK